MHTLLRVIVTIIACIAACSVVLVALIALVAFLEKRMVWYYATPVKQPPLVDIGGYGTRWFEEMFKAGFFFFGWAFDLKPRYKVNYALLASPERDCLVIIGIGTIFGVPVQGTWIYTPAVDGRVFYSTDNQSCIELDVLRNWRSQLVLTNNFAGLLQGHRNLLRSRVIVTRPFSAGREIEEFKRLREVRFQSMSRLGLIKFTDGSATHWRYTLSGAFKFAAQNFSIGLLRAVTRGLLPRIA